MTFIDRMKLTRRIKIVSELTFESGWRIGSGREGMAGSDMGVLLDQVGQPILPGSSLKGCLRSKCETLAHALNMSACCLDRQGSGVDCISDSKYFSQVSAQYQALTTFAARKAWLDTHICDVCQFFGSPLTAGRLRVSAGKRIGDPATVHVRDSVVLDRDSHTARDGLKFDYEVAGAGTKYELEIEFTNPQTNELALLGAALLDWAEGLSVGGFTTRGLGRASFIVKELLSVDLTDHQQRLNWLTKSKKTERYQTVTDWQSFFQDQIQTVFAEAV